MHPVHMAYHLAVRQPKFGCGRQWVVALVFNSRGARIGAGIIFWMLILTLFDFSSALGLITCDNQSLCCLCFHIICQMEVVFHK